jgi:hypothetical protein
LDHKRVPIYLGTPSLAGGVVVEVVLAMTMADRHDPRGIVNRICPISNGLTTVAVGGMDKNL